MTNHVKYINKTVMQVSELRRSLKRGLEESEPRFLKLCQDLQSITADTDQFTELTIGVVKEMAEGANGDSFKGIKARINQSLEELKGCKTGIYSNLDILKKNSNYLERLCATSLVIRSIAKYLNVVSINIGIESSRSTDCEQMFAIFVKELQQLAKLVNETSLNIRGDSEKARANQLAALEEILESQRQLEKLTSEADKAVQNSIEKIEGLIKISMEALESAGRHSKGISREINEIIVAIQFHDIVRQQLEHVLESFLDVVNLCNKESSGRGSEYDKDRLLGRVHSILALQTAQMEQVLSEIESVYRNSTKAFGKVRDEVEMIFAGDADLRESKKDVGIMTPFTDLESSIKTLNSLLYHGRVIEAQMENTITQVSETVSGMSAHLSQIEGIGGDLHVKAINSILLSKRLNENGKALVCLAQEVTGVSTKSEKVVLEIVEILKSITGMADKLVQTSSAEKGSPDNDNSTNSSLKEALDFVGYLGDRYRENSLISNDRSMLLKEKISEVESDLSFLNQMKNKISESLKGVRDIVIELEPFSEEKGVSSFEFDRVTNRYTMDIERGVHDRSFSGKDDSAQEGMDCIVNNDHIPLTNEGDDMDSLDISSVEDEDSDYLGDNIELF